MGGVGEDWDAWDGCDDWDLGRLGPETTGTWDDWDLGRLRHKRAL